MFITKFDATGHAVWSRRFGGTTGHFLQRLGIDAAGGVVLVGSFQGEIDFGDRRLATGKKEVIFIVKLAA